MMKRWWLKCTAQLAFSQVPMGDRVHHLFRRKKLYSQFPEMALNQVIRHIEMLNLANVNIGNETVLEIGAGWKPIPAYIFRIAKCQKVLLCDWHPHLNRKLLSVTINQLRNNARLISKLARINNSDLEKVLPQVSNQNFETLLEKSGFEYKAPIDLGSTNLPNGSIGIITSRSTLEHIPPQRLNQILQEMRRIIKPSGAMVHTIDHSDHWQHFDQSISRINFLKFPDWWWKVIGENKLVYQNRLRSYELIDMIKSAGFKITYIDARPDKQALDDARKMKIIKRYREVNPEKIAVLTTHLVAQPI